MTEGREQRTEKKGFIAILFCAMPYAYISLLPHSEFRLPLTL